MKEGPAVHRDDAAQVYRLAVERGAAGEAYHAVAEGVPFLRIAGALGPEVGVPVSLLTREDAEAHFGGLAVWPTGLGWVPRKLALPSDIDRPDSYG